MPSTTAAARACFTPTQQVLEDPTRPLSAVELEEGLRLTDETPLSLRVRSYRAIFEDDTWSCFGGSAAHCGGGRPGRGGMKEPTRSSLKGEYRTLA